MMLNLDSTTFKTLIAVTWNTLTWSSGNVNIASGDLLVNLGTDGGVSAPDYDGSPMAIYAVPSTTTKITNAEVSSDSTTGNYDFYHDGDGMFWELIRDSGGTPVQIIDGHSTNPRINVCDYGATGDGTTDDSAAINAALRSVNTGGGQVYFPSGNYDCDPATASNPDEGTLTCTEPVHIIIDNAGLILASAAATEVDGLVLTGNRSRIEGRGDAVIQASRSLDDGTAYNVVRFEDSAETMGNVSVENVRFSLTVTGTDANLLLACVRVNATTAARGYDGVRIEDCEFVCGASNNPTLADLRGVYLYNFIGAADNTRILKHAKVINNKFLDFDGQGIQAFACDHLKISGNSMEEMNKGNSAGGGGIVLNGCSNFTVSENTMVSGATGSGNGISMTFAGFDTDLDCTDGVVDSNTIKQENSSQADYGIHAIDCVDCVISRNVLKSTVSVASQFGIRVDDAATNKPTDNMVVGNICTGWNGAGSAGVRVDSGAVRTVVKGNYCSDNATDYIFETASTVIYGDETVLAGLTAEPSGVQGDVPLTMGINEVSTVASANDAVTLPPAVVGQRCVVINSTANILDIYPASGDDCGATANQPVSIASLSTITFYCYDATNWRGGDDKYLVT
jgi:hypothetical protein